MTVASGVADRGYVLYVPANLDRTQPAPLVVDFPAYSLGQLGEQFSGFSRPDALGAVKADDVGAVVVTPVPVNGAGGLLTWNISDVPAWTDDQRYIIDVLADVANRVCIDDDRVLVMGFAIGAVMASTFACANADLVSALVAVAGLHDPVGCEPSRPIPVLAFHGTADPLLPITGGVGPNVGMLQLSGETATGLVEMAMRPETLEAANAWAERNGCAPEPASNPVDIGVNLTSWSSCDAPTELYTVDGGGHTWPGSTGTAGLADLLGPTTDHIIANDIIWDFFTATRSNSLSSSP